MTTVKESVKSAIGILEDNLYRARIQQRADPTWKDSMGHTTDQVIADYEAELSELREDARRYGVRL